jgi:hypothetical protein
MAKYLVNNAAGDIVQGTALAASSGVSDASKIIQTDATGRIDQTMMPVGVAADTKLIEASEALSSGDFVNVWNDGGTAKVRKADATTSGKEVNGFVLDAVVSGVDGLVYFENTNTSLSGLTAGDAYFLSTTPGSVSNTPPTGSGNVVQKIGVAVASTEITFEPTQTITLA